MRPRDLQLVLAALALATLACARAAGPPVISAGTPCAACGMEVADLHFACERPVGRAWRVYDSIECLIRDAGTGPAVSCYLTDYDQGALHAAESVWVVRGEFASPMGGGYAAFLELAAADSIANATRGHVDRLSAFLAAGPGGTW